jgi:hypothetical protein
MILEREFDIVMSEDGLGLKPCSPNTFDIFIKDQIYHDIFEHNFKEDNGEIHFELMALGVAYYIWGQNHIEAWKIRGINTFRLIESYCKKYTHYNHLLKISYIEPDSYFEYQINKVIDRMPKMKNQKLRSKLIRFSKGWIIKGYEWASIMFKDFENVNSIIDNFTKLVEEFMINVTDLNINKVLIKIDSKEPFNVKFITN